VALQMDPERRRRLLAAAQAQREWADRYGIDDPEWSEDGSADRQGRGPTPEQARELERRLREISGQDPDTGLFRTDS
jgi:hypothetical protein